MNPIKHNNQPYRSANVSSSYQEKKSSKIDVDELINDLDADDYCTQILQQLHSGNSLTNERRSPLKNSIINNTDIKKKIENNQNEKPRKFFKTSTRRIPIDEIKVYEQPILNTNTKLSSISTDEQKSSGKKLSDSTEDLTKFLSEIPETPVSCSSLTNHIESINFSSTYSSKGNGFINSQSSLPIHRKEKKSHDKQKNIIRPYEQIFRQKIQNILNIDNEIKEKVKQCNSKNISNVDDSMTDEWAIKQLQEMNQINEKMFRHSTKEFAYEFDIIMSDITTLTDGQLSPTV
ncbi:hypothetical protein DERP_010537 [Dermatophagoides pteronyssinus]|uniref:Uncharacterized protein n=1 Tax=Dermatophagoides pteronyssinus TaxID=6956 RepID=A0ABQ8JFJ2_DERPT|nr:hypothetical protein DERP_010537 [Dermatophagoides pteronyssinus]